MSDAPSTLEELVAPLSEAEFLSLLRERKLAFVRSARANGYSALLSWEKLHGMIERGEHPRGLADFRLIKESDRVRPHHYLVRDGSQTKVDVAKVDELIAKGYSLIVTPIESYAPPLATLCDNIRARLPDRIKVAALVTVGTGGAFKLHYDPEDLIILQVEGTKRWRIYGPAVSNPIFGMPKPPSPPEVGPIFDEVLQPGDFLFVPAGNWHHCENGPDRSLHLGVFFVPPEGAGAVKRLASELVAEELFRTPLSRYENESEREKLEADIKRELIDKITQLKLSDFVAEWNTTGNS